MLYKFFLKGLGDNFTDPAGAPDLSRFRLVDMFTSCTDDDVKKQILHSFSVPSKLRIVIATSSFGMGIDCPDIREIVHLGAPADLETYIQETGRGGRDGNITFAKLLTVNRQNRFCEQSMLGYQKKHFNVSSRPSL